MLCAQIFSLRSNSWRHVTKGLPNYKVQLLDWSNKVTPNGFTYWFGRRFTDKSDTFIISFSLSHEEFQRINVPLICMDSDSRPELILLNDLIALLVYHRGRDFSICEYDLD